MASSEADSRLSQVISPALEKIIKNASWRKHSKLAHECKSVIEKLNLPPKEQEEPIGAELESESNSFGSGPLHDGGPIEYSLVDSESILSPLVSVCKSILGFSFRSG